MKNENLNKAITLVSLVITVIVLLILAGTAVSIAINGGDLFGKTQNAVIKYNAKAAEQNETVTELWEILETLGQEEEYGLVGEGDSERFIVKEIPVIEGVNGPSGTTFSDGKIGFAYGYYELFPIAILGEHGSHAFYKIDGSFTGSIREDVYFCYDGTSWLDGDIYYIYTTSGEFLGYDHEGGPY